MTLDEAIKRYTSNAEYERTHVNLQGYLEFKQLAEWLKELKENKDVLDKIRAEIRELKHFPADSEDKLIYNAGVLDALEIIDKYREGENE